MEFNFDDKEGNNHEVIITVYSMFVDHRIVKEEIASGNYEAEDIIEKAYYFSQSYEIECDDSVKVVLDDEATKLLEAIHKDFVEVNQSADIEALAYELEKMKQSESGSENSFDWV